MNNKSIHGLLDYKKGCIGLAVQHQPWKHNWARCNLHQLRFLFKAAKD